MADMMQFDLVSPERLLVSRQVSEVLIPGAEGDMTAMPSHAPVITTLRPGVLHVVSAEGGEDYAVTGGFAQITAEGVSVLAEQSAPLSALSQDMFDTMLSTAREALERARNGGDGGAIDDASKGVADMVALAGAAGLEASAA